MVEGIAAKHVLADKAYDTDKFRAFLAFIASPVIPSKANRVQPIAYDKHIYRERHLVECFINKIKQFRRVATRYDKTAVSYMGFVAIAACVVLLR